ncbi:WXG100 family type VII secretion target [Streptomyces tsukubensis]|uniref:WXG100 family type VII secretion target n=1 Tax=Streptomyces tsukubensis TaxID=83656 RepID=A0A1V4A724_9ACTN|nr:WXG100 family type VII secretion target [Streptomyces tsukubensis]OON77028.1 hypothetical protein B1H18_20050 [Streptomyces tsukubensis]QFR93732.1 hypothetical protein GBW32_12430 [Streptomyces tsukubensis]
MSDDWVSYDSVKIEVDPAALKEMTTQLKQSITAVSGHLNRINKTLGGLKLNWAGKTSEEYDHMTSEWTRVINMAFGTEKEPEKGALNAVGHGVEQAASNFANTEQGIAKGFDDLIAALGPQLDDAEPAAPKDSLDRVTTAISANYASDYSEGDKDNEEKHDRAVKNGFGHDQETGPDIDAYMENYGGVNTPDDHAAAVKDQKDKDDDVIADYSKSDYDRD